MPPDAPSDRAPKFIIRLPDGMRDRIAEAARAAGRSMNAEIVHRLERSFAPPEISEAMKDAWLGGYRDAMGETLKAATAETLREVLALLSAHSNEPAWRAEVSRALAPLLHRKPPTAP